MSDAFSIQSLRTTWPRMSSPRIARAFSSASAGSSASLMPPALPRPPVSTCALTTTGPPSDDAVAFSVREGEVFGLLGPNGAGKSTTVRALATLTQPDSGRALVAGEDVARHPNRVRRAIGYVAQDSGVDWEATGRENLLLQGRIHGMAGASLRLRVEELLELVGLRDAADPVARGYSGGVKRPLDNAIRLVHP